MTKFVRVELENGSLATVAEAVAESAGLEPLDPETHPAVDGRGRPLPPEFPESAPEADTSASPSATTVSREADAEDDLTVAPSSADTTTHTAGS